MVTVLLVSRHTPDMCALYNEAAANVYMAGMSKQAELEAKHGVKMVGGWNVPSEHLTIQVFEAPTFEAIEAFSMEPEVMALSSVDTIEVKVAYKLEEMGQMLMQKMRAK